MFLRAGNHLESPQPSAHLPACLLEDIQTLNQKAKRQGEYRAQRHLLSARPIANYVADKYAVLAAGSSVGDMLSGPMVGLAPHPMAPLRS